MSTRPDHRRQFLIAAGASLTGLLAMTPAAAQSSFPSRPVRIIVPWPASGAADVSARVGALELEKLLGQPVVIDNKPGGLFQVALQALAQAPADGHTLIHITSGMLAVQAVHGRFNLNRDLVPLTLVGDTSMVLIVGPKSPHRTLVDLIDYGRANPGQLKYASSGLGSLEHLKLAQMEKVAGFSALNVPYRGGPDMLKAVIGGEVDFTLVATIFASQFAPKGMVRVLATLDSSRLAQFPEAPTLAEAGVSVPPMRIWGGYAVASGTPVAIVQRLYRDLVASSASPAIVRQMAQLGMTVFNSNSPEDFRRQIEADLAWMTAMVKDLKLAQ
jgi:tripartite-type tricarboxylate transporter receptor subunit TctC